MVKRVSAKDLTVQAKRLTYYTKHPFKCPVCGAQVKQEKLLSGGGRLVVESINDELRTIYKPTQKWGKVNPLIYEVVVCPKCFYAAYPDDFSKLPKEALEYLKETIPRRKDIIVSFFREPLDFNKARDTKTGAASYILALLSYSFFPADFNPTFKKALSALRAAWLFDDLMEEEPDRRDLWERHREYFYDRALELFIEVVEKDQRGEERLENVKFMGPSTDHNWGYQGMLYLIGRLLKRKADLSYSNAEKSEYLEEAKKYLRIAFGDGKIDKMKPSALIEFARELYKEINETLGSAQQEF